MKLIADDLSVERGGRTLIHRLSLTVAEGEALVVTGPNGVGKSSLLRTLAGLTRPAAGSIRIEGGAPETEIGEECHYVGHRDGVNGALTVAENARFWAGYLAVEQAPAMLDPAAALGEIGLGALGEVPAAYLSAGQRRRLGLARLVLARRPVWLLDEPTVSLDASGVEMLSRLIGAHLASGGLVVAATHQPLGIANARSLALAPLRRHDAGDDMAEGVEA